MTRTAIKGVNLIISIGIPSDPVPTATYVAGTVTGGLKKMTIANEPTTMYYVPTARTSDLHKTKSSERIKFLGGDETGDTFELDEAIMGSLDLVLCRSTSDESLYDPAIDLLIQSAITSNAPLYIKMERYIGAKTVSSVTTHNYHVKAALVKVRSDNNTSSADAKAQQQQFTVEGFGEWMEGYVSKAAP